MRRNLSVGVLLFLAVGSLSLRYGDNLGWAESVLWSAAGLPIVCIVGISVYGWTTFFRDVKAYFFARRLRKALDPIARSVGANSMMTWEATTYLKRISSPISDWAFSLDESCVQLRYRLSDEHGLGLEVFKDRFNVFSFGPTPESGSEMSSRYDLLCTAMFNLRRHELRLPDRVVHR